MDTRVLMVLDSIFPTPGGGGAESQVRTLCRHLKGRGMDVSVIVPMVRYGAQVEHDLLDGIKVHRIPYPKWPLMGALIMLLRLAWRLFRSRRDYSFIHAHIAGNMAAVCSVMGYCLNKPVLIKITGMTEMVGGILDPSPTWLARFNRKLMRLATYYQATSSQIARMLVESGFAANKVQLIPNAVDTTRFEAAPSAGVSRQSLCGHRRWVGVYVGRLEQEKDLTLMIRGWAHAFRGDAGVALIMVGGGGLRRELECLASELGIADQVIFVGPTMAVERYLSISDVGLLTSRAEGLSNTLLEYMAAGLPVIGTEVSGTEDFVINGRTGWLFPVGDEVQLQQCLRSAATMEGDALKALGFNAKQRVVAEASISAVVDRLTKLYTSNT